MHVTQRGVNRCAIFLEDDDRLHYRRLLRAACSAHDVAVHAYVLMDNHVHLLLIAQRSGDVSCAMRDAGQMYVQAFNARHRRSGTLWQGRFKSCLVGTDAYLLAVMRYIELNPLRAGMVPDAADYRWSSAHAHLGLRVDGLLRPHPLWLGLGANAIDRAAAWRRWLDAGTDAGTLESIRRHLEQGRALGDLRFQRMAERTLNRPVVLRPRGRPPAKPA